MGVADRTVVLFGASGFVGGAVARALARCEVKVVASPRLTTAARTMPAIEAEVGRSTDLVRSLARELAGAHVVVNAAGNPDASSLDEDVLFGANALLPAILLTAAREAGIERFVHVSSAVVQNDRSVLDSSEDMRPFSPYSSSKVLGEQVVRELSGEGIDVTRYRPPSVHAPGRRVTRMIARIASSPAASVAMPGDQPTPQALLPNVGAAVAFLATTRHVPPAVVHHPSEGVTVTGLMQDLGGGRRPLRLPRFVARFLVFVARMVGRLHRPTAANARRMELLWLGQDQAPSWFDEIGWTAPVGRDAWRGLVGKDDA